MPNITVGTYKNQNINLNYVDYGEGSPVVLIHGWPLSHLMWENQFMALTGAGYRVVAYDRRGFGDSSKPWSGYDYDTFASDLNRLMEELDLRDAALVGFSMGGGEVARYLGTYGSERVSKAVLMAAITPFMLKTDDNASGVDQSVFDGMIKGLEKDRPGFLLDFCKSFVNWDKDGKDLISEAALNHSWDIATWASSKASIDCVRAFSATDFRADLAKLAVPTLVLHGDADGIVPFEVSGKIAHEQISGSELLVIKGGSHGLTYTHPEQTNAALLKFLAS